MPNLLLLLGVANLLASLVASTGPRLPCQLMSGVVNCSAKVNESYGKAYFFQPHMEEYKVSLSLPHGPRDFSIASLEGLVSRFFPPGYLSVVLTPGHGHCRLLPGCLDSLGDIERLTLRLRLAESRVPGEVFTTSLARLRSLQLETPQISQVAPGAFSQLHNLERLSLANLDIDHIDESLLRGLPSLRILELPENRFVSLDASSFTSSPLLETIDLRSPGTGQLAVAADTFCGLHRLRQLQIAAAAGLNCSHFASRRLYLILSSRVESRTVSCIRRLGQATACAGSSVIQLTSVVMRATSATMTELKTTKSFVSRGTVTKVATVTTPRATSSRSNAIGTNKTAVTIAEWSQKLTTLTAAQNWASSTSVSKAGHQLGKQATGSASGASAGLIIAVVVAAVLLLAAVSMAAAFATRRVRFAGSSSGVSLRRSRSQQPIFSPGPEIDMQDAVWNPSFQENSSFGTTASEDHD